MQRAICDLVAEGVPFDNACRLVGVSREAGFEWLRRGLGREPDRPSTPEFVNFAHAIAHARAKDERRRLARISRAAEGGVVVSERLIPQKDGTVITERRYAPPDWRADAWVLERRDPERWAPVTATAPTSPPNVNIDMREILESIEAKENGRALPAAPEVEPRDPRPPRPEQS